MRTRFTELVGCRLPVENAAMGGVGSVDLALAVAGAGGLGMMPSYLEPPKSESPLGVNFLAPGGFDLDAIADVAGRVRVVEFFYGNPDPEPVRVAKGEGALVAWQVGSRAEAKAAIGAGVDLLVAQGIEAGGHIRGTTSLDKLLGEIRTIAPEIPLVAAGGIATAERVAQVIELGADGVRVGTRFVATHECDAHPDYVARLIAAKSGDDTVVTTHFNAGWPNAPHRVLTSSLDAAKARGYHQVTPPSRDVEGDASYRALYAGQGVGHVTRIESAADVVDDLVRLL